MTMTTRAIPVMVACRASAIQPAIAAPKRRHYPNEQHGAECLAGSSGVGWDWIGAKQHQKRDASDGCDKQDSSDPQNNHDRHLTMEGIAGRCLDGGPSR